MYIIFYHMNIVFVCTGNASRSPFAECVMRRLLADGGVRGVEVSSVGTLDWGVNPRNEFMVRAAEGLGYALTGTTTYMTREALMAADRIIVFEQAHRNVVTRVLDYARWERIALFDQLAYGCDTEVPDPYGQTVETYYAVAHHIEEGCKRLVQQVLKFEIKQ